MNIQRLRDTRFQLPYPVLMLLGFAWIVGALLLGAYLTHTGEQARLLTAASFLAAAAAGTILAAFSTAPEITYHRLYLGVGAALSFGLLVLPAADSWSWWIALAAIAIIPVIQDAPTRQSAKFYAGAVAVSAAVGVLIADTRGQNWDLVILGLGMLLAGQFWALTRPMMSMKHTPTMLQAQEMRIETMETMKPADLVELTTRIHVTADGLVRSAQAITEVAEQQSSGAAEQAAVLNITNDMMENFLKLSERISDQAREMTQTAQQTMQDSTEGQTAIHEAISGMDGIRQQVNAIGSTIVTLAQLTRRIDEIITSVSEIATQSTLLALNASIEAARAGTQGRGFAVVADEVRSLSQQSTSAADQVRIILAEIQAAVRQAVSAIEIGTKSVEEGILRTQQADRVMMQLTRTMDGSNRSVKDIYNVIRQQTEGLEEIAINMERIDRITQANLTSTHLVATVSTNLTRLADDLQHAIEVGRRTAEMPIITDSMV